MVQTITFVERHLLKVVIEPSDEEQQNTYVDESLPNRIDRATQILMLFFIQFLAAGNNTNTINTVPPTQGDCRRNVNDTRNYVDQ